MSFELRPWLRDGEKFDDTLRVFMVFASSELDTPLGLADSLELLLLRNAELGPPLTDPDDVPPLNIGICC